MLGLQFYNYRDFLLPFLNTETKFALCQSVVDVSNDLIISARAPVYLSQQQVIVSSGHGNLSIFKPAGIQYILFGMEARTRHPRCYKCKRGKLMNKNSNYRSIHWPAIGTILYCSWDVDFAHETSICYPWTNCHVRAFQILYKAQACWWACRHVLEPRLHSLKCTEFNGLL